MGKPEVVSVNRRYQRNWLCAAAYRPIRYVEKKTFEFTVEATRIADFPSRIGAGFAESGFIFESFMRSSSTLRCSCGWGRIVWVMVQLSHLIRTDEKHSSKPY